MTCLPAITGKLMIARIHGTVSSILFALAISNAPADQGFVNSTDGFGRAGEPGCACDCALSVELEFVGSDGMSNEGERIGEENDRR